MAVFWNSARQGQMTMGKEITFVDLHPSQGVFLQDVLNGLSLPQKALSPKYLYDEMGVELFTKICSVEEYYPTRTEMDILQQSAMDIDEHFSQNVLIIELGSGGNRKISELLHRTQKVRAYTPIDIARQQLLESAVALKHTFPRLDITAICGDYTAIPPVSELIDQAYEQQVVFFPGSTLGNLTHDEAVALLRRTRTFLRSGDYFLLGVDLLKDIGTLEAAYNDREGITAQFNLNLLTRMNRELGANFDMRNFQHRAVFNEKFHRIEMHIVSLIPQTVHIQGREFDFKEGETIHTESSHKFTLDGIARLAATGDFTVSSAWTDSREYFAEILLRAA